MGVLVVVYFTFKYGIMQLYLLIPKAGQFMTDIRHKTVTVGMITYASNYTYKYLFLNYIREPITNTFKNIPKSRAQEKSVTYI